MRPLPPGGPPREGPLLPCTGHPGEGELLSSWLVRLAQAHRVKVESFCRYLWPGLVVWKRDVDKLAPAPLLATLAERTLTPAGRILATTLAPVAERLTGVPLATGQGLTPWVMPVSIQHRTHRGYGLVYCPLCLQRDGPAPYFRVPWRLAFHVVCPTCGVYLREGCPLCGTPVTYFRLDVGQADGTRPRPLSTCWRCGLDLRQAPARAAPPAVVNRYRALYEIGRVGWCPTVPFPHQYFQVLRQLVRLLSCPFGEALELQAALRRVLGQPEEWFSGGGAFEQLPLVERAYLLEQALWLLDEWPDRFVDVLHAHGLKSHVILRDVAGDVPFWFASVVLEQFYVARTNRRFTRLAPLHSKANWTRAPHVFETPGR